MINATCFSQQKRSCLDTIIGLTVNQTREKVVSCPGIRCSNWATENQLRYVNGVCVSTQKRFCSHQLSGDMFEENREKNVTCPPKVEGKNIFSPGYCYFCLLQRIILCCQKITAMHKKYVLLVFIETKIINKNV